MGHSKSHTNLFDRIRKGFPGILVWIPLFFFSLLLIAYSFQGRTSASWKLCTKDGILILLVQPEYFQEITRGRKIEHILLSGELTVKRHSNFECVASHEIKLLSSLLTLGFVKNLLSSLPIKIGAGKFEGMLFLGASVNDSINRIQFKDLIAISESSLNKKLINFSTNAWVPTRLNLASVPLYAGTIPTNLAELRHTLAAAIHHGPLWKFIWLDHLNLAFEAQCMETPKEFLCFLHRSIDPIEEIPEFLKKQKTTEENKTKAISKQLALFQFRAARL